MLYLTGIIISYFLFILLISKKNKSIADKVLALWLCVIGIHLQLFYLHFSRQYIHFPYLLGLEIPMPLLHGPFLYLYICALTNSSLHLVKVSFHFLPALLAYCLIIPFFLLSPEQKISIYQHNGQGFEQITLSIFVSIVLSGIVYIVFSWYLIGRYKNRIANHFSVVEKTNVKWILYLIYGVGVIWIVVIVGNDTLTFAIVAAFAVLIGYTGIIQGNIFSTYRVSFAGVPTASGFDSELHTKHYNADISLRPASEERDTPIKLKYQKSTLREEEGIRIHQQLQQLMRVEKLFKNPELTLGELAEKLSVHQNTLSQVVNSFEQKHFYDYVNHLRIEAFKETVQLQESRKYTLLALAFDCGFNSKTTFNRTFKKSVGISPKEYVAEINQTKGCKEIYIN